MAKRVLVFGGTGMVGSMVVELLMQKGYEVCILVRDNPKSIEKALPLVQMGAQIVKGDLTDEFLFVNPTPVWLELKESDMVVWTAAAFDTSFTETATSFMLTAEDIGIQHVVYLSNYPRLRPLLPMFLGKYELESILRGGTIPYTILQAEPFIDTAVSHMIKPALEYGYPIGLFAPNDEQAQKGEHYWIAASDVAMAIAAVLGNKAAFNKTYHIGGPIPLTFSRLAQRYGELNRVGISTLVYTKPPKGVDQGLYNIMEQLCLYNSPIPQDIQKEYGVVPTDPDIVLKQAV